MIRPRVFAINGLVPVIEPERHVMNLPGVLLLIEFRQPSQGSE